MKRGGGRRDGREETNCNTSKFIILNIQDAHIHTLEEHNTGNECSKCTVGLWSMYSTIWSVEVVCFACCT